MKRLLIIFIVLSTVLIPITVEAHPGRTDGAGGHYDNNAGEYHYHHGYSAHQHTNDECPYDSNYIAEHYVILESEPDEEVEETFQEHIENEYQETDVENTQSTPSKRNFKEKVKFILDFIHEHPFYSIFIYLLFTFTGSALLDLIKKIINRK